MKKAAHDQAKKMFFRSKGRITNKEIADAVMVNPLTVGRWKRDEDWMELLSQPKPPRKPGPSLIRKKTERDKALEIFLESGGEVTNKELAQRTGVSAATIAKWKQDDNWTGQLASRSVEEQPAPLPFPEPTPTPAAEERDVDMAALVAPEQIVRINEKIDAILAREYLTAGEVAQLAEAKKDALEAVDIYVTIARELGVI
jgi:hypothetical protein